MVLSGEMWQKLVYRETNTLSKKPNEFISCIIKSPSYHMAMQDFGSVLPVLSISIHFSVLFSNLDNFKQLAAFITLYSICLWMVTNFYILSQSQ